MGGQTTRETTVENRDPWAPAQPFLLKGLNEAERIYETQKSKNDPGYTGPMVAQPTDTQQTGAGGLMDWGLNTGYGQASGQFAGGNALTGVGAGGLNAASNALNKFGASDLPGANIDAAGRYANNPYMDGMVQAATRDATRQFNEQTMPGIDAQAAATGNFNSTRAGVATGLAQSTLR